jgi:hypothetical protein
MLESAGPLAVVALVLLAGGLLKLRDVRPTRQMFETLVGRPHAGLKVLAVVSAAVEVALGIVTFLVGGRVWAGCTALAFAVFTAVAWRLTRAANAPCGCFGRHSGRTTLVHVGVNAGMLVIAALAAVVDAPGFLAARPDLPAAGVPFVGLALVGAWLAIAAMTVLPEAMLAARRGPRAPLVRHFELTGRP